MSDSLYRFDYDESSGVITRTEITDYEEGSRHSYSYFKYKLMKGVWQYVYIDKFDMLKHHTIHSFNSSTEHAKQIIEDTLAAKLHKAENDVERYAKSLTKLREFEASE